MERELYTDCQLGHQQIPAEMMGLWKSSFTFILKGIYPGINEQDIFCGNEIQIHLASELMTNACAYADIIIRQKFPEYFYPPEDLAVEEQYVYDTMNNPHQPRYSRRNAELQSKNHNASPRGPGRYSNRD